MNQETTETIKTSGCAQQVSGNWVEFGPGFAGMVKASESTSVAKAGALVIQAGHEIEVENGGALVMVAGQGMKLTNGGMQIAVVGGNLELTNGGVQTAVAGGSLVANHSFVGIAFSPKTVMGEGSRLLLNQPLAIAFGLAFGAAYALVRWITRK